MFARSILPSMGLALLLAACASLSPQLAPEAQFRAVNRIGWGATSAQLDDAARLGWPSYVEQQLHADPRKPLALAAAQAQINALKVQQRDVSELLLQVDTLRREQDKSASEDERKAARQAYQAQLNTLSRETAHRQLLRQIYSDQQLLEHMSWFWFNHFNVHQQKRELRALVADYEESALRPQALGSFRTLLGAVARHPAMLRYLDNDQNSAGKPNENYARELLELHTMGVDGGYTQKDVQELARVLTGFGTRLEPGAPKLRPDQARQYVRQGLFEFNPARHDFGDKLLLGHTIKGRGAAELDEALDLLVAQPATAHFVSQRLAMFFLSDTPPADLVARMAERFQRSGGRIDETLRVLLLAPEFAAAEPRKFKDPQHFIVSGLRAAYADQVIVNSQPVQAWLRRLGEGQYDKLTPDGYPLVAEAWNSAGQLGTRFELARALGSGPAALFKAESPEVSVSVPVPVPAPKPLLRSAWFEQHLAPRLSVGTRDALALAATPADWNALFLSAPEFMYR